ncbi:decarboxylating 6-phosphogluconate dehydrogenase [Novosphingobium sp. ZN18A2]|uniref:phosphogluconate dehydrogenase (NAD(+)-dependent, decarboxylating) n=1 Tax=Novosphingobium sp. ZN18A2 TaxID=3079861 RepID=UPI0030CF0417
MHIGFVGLGKMGGNMVRRLTQGGHTCHIFSPIEDERTALADETGAIAAESLEALVKGLAPPRSVWVMVPSGDAVGQVVNDLAGLLEKGDTVIDGGNSHFKDSVARGKLLAESGVDFLDCGTSGGVFGLERGYSLMIGGDAAAVKRNAPIFKALAPGMDAAARTPAREGGAEAPGEAGWLHCGPSGAGHYVKMVHNGVEYGLMQAYAEGFALFASAGGEQVPEDYRYDLDLAAIAEVWRRGSVVASWLLDLGADALADDPSLDRYSPQVADSGEGRWTLDAAIDQGVSVQVMAAALFARFDSRDEKRVADRVLSAMRFKFGGHREFMK